MTFKIIIFESKYIKWNKMLGNFYMLMLYMGPIYSNMALSGI